MRIAVLGAGSWGTALAMQLARAGNETVLWGRDATQIEQMARDGENRRYLPNLAFPAGLSVASQLQSTLLGTEIALIATPSDAFLSTLRSAKPAIEARCKIAWASKGFEPSSGRLLHEVAKDLLGPAQPGAVVTGPSFAKEVAAELPTAVVVASPDGEFASQLASALHAGNFRAYTSNDIVGAELGGAIKNVLAVGTGIADGMALGTNARAALITRGLAEMIRLSVALGARPETLMGLSGVGDLVLTCTGDLSRNRRFGLALGRGQPIEHALAEIGQVVEGVKTAEAVCRLSAHYRVEMPISEQVLRIVRGEITPREGVRNLLQREPKAED